METLSRGAAAAATRVEAFASAFPDVVLGVYAVLIIAALGGLSTTLVAESFELRLLGAAVAVLCAVAYLALDWRAV